MSLRDFFSIFSTGGHFFLLNQTICAILMEGIMGNICMKLF